MVYILAKSDMLSAKEPKTKDIALAPSFFFVILRKILWQKLHIF